MTRARDLSNLMGSGNFSSTTFTATAGQTAFTIAHTQGFVQVFMNGLLLDLTTDYTSNGSAITLTTAAAAGDEIEVVKYNTFSVGDAVPASGGTFTGNVNIPGHILQTVQVEHSAADTTTLTRVDVSSTSYTDILSKSITTKADNSIIRVMCCIIGYNSSTLRGRGKVLRDTTTILFDPYPWHHPAQGMNRFFVDLFDQPNVNAGTSLTYKVQGNSNNGTMMYLYSDGGGTTANFITLQEIAQ